MRITRNAHDAEDVQQETFLKAYRNIRQFEGRSQLTTWISSIAINEGRMLLRRKRNYGSLIDVENSEHLPATRYPWRRPAGPEGAYYQKELRQILSGAIDKLQPKLRIVFHLRVERDMSVAHTACALNISEPAVKARLRRARLSLKRSLNSAGLQVPNSLPSGLP